MRKERAAGASAYRAAGPLALGVSVNGRARLLPPPFLRHVARPGQLVGAGAGGRGEAAVGRGEEQLCGGGGGGGSSSSSRRGAGGAGLGAGGAAGGLGGAPQPGQGTRQ